MADWVTISSLATVSGTLVLAVATFASVRSANRAARKQTRWSAHAYGLAIDLDPFQNPYRRGDLVLPELASAYLDRDRYRPGMIHPGDPVTRAFAAIGWTWGGTWRTPKDLMHVSATGG